ncbi:cell division protein FtsQ/DivIB [Snodgrassella communis]|uniref:cell division protein FtsQ/DivIB n=1 Tax=Snodgrassella communis TaxID=2946699 RepID=UPI00286D497C|nr:cell division protein FtsQ/DivIB [Snodgrassella communis]WMY92540.1 cell division protein FtsQ/DivIB [Snodgrassella communis]
MRLWDNAQALKRLYRWLYVCVLFCLLAAGVTWVVHSPYFPVRQIQVLQPLKHLQSTEIAKISRQYLRGNIFTVNVSAAQAELAKLPWVAKVQVKRIWPDTVQLDIKERVPVARWNTQQLVDMDGRIFNAAIQEQLPLLVGTTGSTRHMTVHLLTFENLLQPTGLHVQELQLSDRSAWQLILTNGITLRLGREKVEQRLASFVWAWQQVLQNQASNIDYVDLRYPDGFALRYKNRTVSEPAGVNITDAAAAMDQHGA